MSGSTIKKPGAKFFDSAQQPAKATPSIDQLMEEVDGAIDHAINAAARDAALRHVRDGRMVPVWERNQVVMKPADQALAESDSDAALETRKPRQ